MRHYLFYAILACLLLAACKNESNLLTQTVFLKKMEREIRYENTDQIAIQYFDKLIQLKATLEKAEVRVLGFKYIDLPNDLMEGSKKKLRQDAEWKKFNGQMVIVKSKLKKHLKANYPEYAKVVSDKNSSTKSVPLKINKKGQKN